MRSLVAVPLLILATVAAAEDRPLYSAQDSLRRAQVGTFSPRLAPPVRVQETPEEPRASSSAWSAARTPADRWNGPSFAPQSNPKK